MRRCLALALALAAGACDAPATVGFDARSVDGASAAPPFVAGASVGPIALGMTWGELVTALGPPTTDPVVLVRLGHARWEALGLEAVLVSSDEATLSDDAVVIGAATTAATIDRRAIEASIGAPGETLGDLDHYPAGLGVRYRADGGAALVAVVAPYVLRPDPPPMTPVSTAPGPIRRGPAPAAIVDAHLHPGDYGAMATSGKAFIVANLPPFLRPYAPAILDALSDPYAPHVGIQAQAALAGVDHVVLFAVYTQHTTGYFTNEALAEVLDDPRNVAADGRPWAWGMASIDLEGWSPEVAPARLAALRSHLVRRADRFIGIKLAHAHQGVPLDDATSRAIYDVARETGAPVLLHTGFSPFPGAEDEAAYYDPVHLAAAVTEYDDVDFVLSHIGQGDARAVAHALALAEAHPNVWLELSALGRPLVLDENGAPVTTADPQYPAVLEEIRARDLIDRTLYASDGPQGSGTLRSYLGRIRDGMVAAGYTADEIAAVLGGNFTRLFFE